MRILSIAILSVVLVPILFSDCRGSATISEFLATAMNDYTLSPQDAKNNFLRSSPPDGAWLDRVEFRTETDRFDISNQKYSLRFYPRGFGEASEEKKVHNALLTLNKSRRNLLMHEALKRRYALVVNFLHIRRLVDLNEKMDILNEDRLNVLTKRMNSLDFDVKDLIAAEEAAIEIKLEKTRLKTRLNRITDKIRRYIGSKGPILFDKEALIDLDRIGEIVETVNNDEDHQDADMEESRTRVALSRADYDLEKSKTRRYFDFFKITYDNESRSDPKELGFVLPFFNSDKLYTKKKELEYLTEKSRHKMRVKAKTENLKALLDELEGIMEAHRILKRKKDNKKAESFLLTYMGLDGVDPLILLKIRERVLKMDMAIEDSHHAIFTAYIMFMDESGKLSENPMVNLISAVMERIGK